MKKSLSLLGKTAAYALLVAAFAASVVQTADARPWHGRDFHHDRHWHGGPPPAVYAPAPVVYAPPEPSPGINLVLPMNFH